MQVHLEFIAFECALQLYHNDSQESETGLKATENVTSNFRSNRQLTWEKILFRHKQETRRLQKRT